ncbi:MAG: D-glycero-beta-D-manno-heptose-7-phosphate kinase [Pseudomonadota bacterium]
MLDDLKKCFENANVLCIGDVMVDRFVYGKVERISPESPIPVLQIQRNFTVLGGAGNVARNILSLGGCCHLLTVSGNDAVADELELLFTQEVNLNAFVVRDLARTTTCKTRFVSNGQQMLRVDDEITTPISESTQTLLIDAFTKIVAQTKVVILSDYAKGIFNADFCQTLIKIAKTAGAMIVIDPKGKTYERYRGATLLTPNMKELAEAVPYPIVTQDDIVKAARDMCAQYDISAMLVTQGANGMTLVTESGAQHIETEAKEVFDVSGAGDTVIATLSVALSSQLALSEAAVLANKAAGIAVGKIGTATVTLAELQAVYHHSGMLHDETKKNCTREAALDAVKMWRRQGVTVGFTNGCFDILHLGHLHILKEAAAACDRLIVGVNSDASVRRLKGDSRPVQDEETRSNILASLSFVDVVVIFDEATPLELIELFQPDVLVKGSDYTADRVVGSAAVQARGGKVVLVDLMQGHSTTATIKRMA